MEEQGGEAGLSPKWFRFVREIAPLHTTYLDLLDDDTGHPSLADAEIYPWLLDKRGSIITYIHSSPGKEGLPWKIYIS